MHANSTKDMTTGRPLVLITRFMIPLLLGNLFQQTYNMIDAIIVGRMLGADALSSVGVSSSVQLLVLQFCIGSCVGFAIPVAQKFGAGDHKSMRSYIYHSVLLAAGMALAATLFTTLFCHKIMGLLHTPADIYDDAYRYLFVIFLGIPFSILYNMLSSLLRAVGNSKIPFVFLAISTVLNIFLDLFCIAVLEWGVAGAAIATISSQVLSGFACLIYILKRMRILVPVKEERKFSANITGKLLGVGLPMGIQYSFVAIGIMIMQTYNNTLGSDYVAGFTAATKIKQFLLCPYDAFGTALATFVSQNYGAGHISRVKKGVIDSLILSLVYGVIAGCVMIFLGRPLASLFLESGDAVILNASAQYLRAMGYLFWILAILNTSRFTTQALGYSGRAVFSGVTEMLTRGLVSMTFIPRYGYTAVCWTDQCAWITATIYITTVCLLLLRKISEKPAL